MNASDPRRTALRREALAFAPGLLAIQESPPAPLPRAALYGVGLLFVLLLTWAALGRLDVIASANGRLVPRSYIKIVQPADAGIIKEILVHEGESVAAGQVLLRLDPEELRADGEELSSALVLKSLEIRRIDGELSGRALMQRSDEPRDLFERIRAQFDDRRRAYQDALAESQAALERAQEDYQSGLDTLEKLRETTPLLQTQANSYEELGKQGYAARVLVDEKQRAYLESEQDLRAQQAKVGSLDAAVSVAQQEVSETVSKYRSDLQNERVQAVGDLMKLREESIKQAYKAKLLELRAPQAGVVKDLATHTIGAVVSAGTVLLSLVPEHEPMVAEVMVRNEDVGFVREGQPVEIKLAAYPFQKYGMLHGQVLEVSPDSATNEAPSSNKEGASISDSADNRSTGAGGYRALIQLSAQSLARGPLDLELLPGMEVIAEINEGRRTVLEYLVSPLQRVVQESGRER